MDSVAKLFDNKKVKVLAGDIHQGDWEFNGGVLWGGFDQINIGADLVKIEVKNEESAKNIAQTLGWAIAGNIVLGPLGLLAGAAMGGNRKNVCAMCELKDGRKFLAVMDSKIFQQMLALTMSV
ncbi:MAG TPA: hypothetical protein PKN86_13070 [Candidatus Obscuribacter sp.]|nr:hypothetical protein [Candidatus Melainabacteria bacterium]MBK8220425.1 hypothetical protein [Candidatus Obscuribacter sp.]MBK9279013.1 hypothetical protein [Candidatus Obscuribacter sp.]MBL8081094.1 hypothetical protein [Candidatus Obscuribacter sp.]MDX1986000.1 hypothetical protein [Candidatus Obscuribacter sp.]